VQYGEGINPFMQKESIVILSLLLQFALVIGIAWFAVDLIRFMLIEFKI